MDNQTPKPMRKVRRNLFHKVGRKLEKFEQSLTMPNQRGSVVSLDDFAESDNRQYSEQEDSVSLQYIAQRDSDTPKAVFRQNHETRFVRPHSSATLHDDPAVDPTVEVYDSPYEKEMQVICKELMENKTVNLYFWRDYDKKVALLRTAVSFNTPRVTGPIILFLENTLSKPLFYELIKQYPSAVKNYINLAKLRLGYDDHVAMLKHFGKNEAVAMMHLRQASQTNSIDRQLNQLDQAAIELSSHPWWHSQVAEYRYLLQKQRELQLSIAPSQPKIRLENRTVLETFKILFDMDFRRHKQSRHTTPEHNQDFERAFHITPEMILCGKLAVIMQCGFRMHYEDFVHQAVHQGIFGKKFIIAPEHLADMVYKWITLSGEGHSKASEKTQTFVNMIQDPLRRIYYAEKFHNYDIAIDTIANVLRDRMQLENLRKRMPADHPSYHRATAMLEETKWKN